MRVAFVNPRIAEGYNFLSFTPPHTKDERPFRLHTLEPHFHKTWGLWMVGPGAKADKHLDLSMNDVCVLGFDYKTHALFDLRDSNKLAMELLDALSKQVADHKHRREIMIHLSAVAAFIKD